MIYKGNVYYIVHVKYDLCRSKFHKGIIVEPPKVDSDRRKEMKKESHLLFRQFDNRHDANKKLKIAKKRYGDIFDVTSVASY